MKAMGLCVCVRACVCVCAPNTTALPDIIVGNLKLQNRLNFFHAAKFSLVHLVGKKITEKLFHIILPHAKAGGWGEGLK